MESYRKRHHSFKESQRFHSQPMRRFSVCFGRRSLSVDRRGAYEEPIQISPLVDSEFRSEGSVFVRPSCPAISLDKMLSLDQEEGCQISPDSLADDFMHNQGGQRNTLYSMDFTHPLLQRGSVLSKSNRSSHGSDTSSAYSGSDTMQSVQSVSLDDQDVDLSGLVESIVDSDEEEELTESMESLTVRDTVRECLEKDPALRTEEDVGVILEYMQHLPAFANMTLTVRKALCAVMVFAVVDKPGVVVMNDGEELDSWSVIVNGAVEIELPDGKIKELQIGDSFGITPTMAKMYQVGVMRTKVEDCQFVCVAQSDYYRILHQGEENIKKHEENGKLIYVTELRTVDAAGNKSHIIIRGTPERLLEQLVEDNSTDVTYVEDFLLAYRTFISDCKIIADKLLVWFDDPRYRDRVTRVVLLWVHNHFTDFETDVRMMEFLEQFELKLEKEKMLGQQRLLNIACAAKARSRVITLARSTREEVLHFSILGGYETGFATFVSKVDKGSKAEEVGLKRGDQILEVNGQSFEVMSHVRALELLRGTTHLCITVKSNLLAFKEMLSAPENSTRRCRKASEISLLQHDPRARLSSQVEWHETMGSSCGTMPGSPTSKVNGLAFRSSDGKKDGEKKGYSTLGHRAKLRRVLAKINIIPRTLNSESHLNSSDDSLCSGNSSSSGGSGNYSGRGSSPQPCTGGGLYHSHSNPDLTSLLPSDDLRLEFPEHVLKVYRSDQTCKYLLVHKETTAREVVMLSLREFGITESSSKYCLCEVSVGEGGVVKQRRLPDPQQNLAERISLSSRYYLKNNMCSDSLVPDELAVELLRDSQVHLLQLNSVELATQLTIEDFSIFRQIEPTEYIDELFEVKSKYGTPMLSKFVELVNREMFWVVTEVCFEHNLLRRMRIIKQFIKVARQCKECKNFNSMFAIISGLGHGAVSRLRTTWEKLPTKYMKLFEDLQDFMDPSRNMYKYRNLISSDHIQPPMIPFYPVLKKDLTFIHLGNDSYIDGLVNFEKLRMVAKEIRTVVSMCSAPYDLFNMLESGGAHPTAAMASLNSFATTTNAATVKRRKKSSAQPNPKKMFEEAQMVRRVKAYLSNLKVVTDEDQLHAMSVECEPLITSGVSTLQVRKRQPSPTLSAASSNSSSSDFKKCNSSKFGADSPQAVRKLLALSDPNKVRPHQPLRPPVSGSPSLSPVSVRRCHDPRPSFSAEMGNATIPVDLYPESSSVTSFGMASIKKSQTSGSVTSSESLHLQHCETDSGHGSASFDSHSNSSGGSTNSPPHLKRNASGPSASHSIKKFSE